jgi:hypothetical protein
MFIVREWGATEKSKCHIINIHIYRNVSWFLEHFQAIRRNLRDFFLIKMFVWIPAHDAQIERERRLPTLSGDVSE